MKFAFSTLASPKWDFQTIASKAKEFGYGGVEIRGFLNESILTAANVFLSEPKKVREIFASQGVEISCLSSSISVSGKKRRDKLAAEDLHRYVDAAADLGAGYVKIADTQVRPGQNRSEAASALAAWLTPLGDYAAEAGVTILINNLLSFRNAKEMWLILEMLNHPAVAAAWDVFSAAAIGEVPSVSVPTLNNRIQYVQVKDALLGPLGANFCKLGEGNVKIQDFLRRLRGIGYAGWVCYEWEKAWLPNLIGEADDVLPHAIKMLKQWTATEAEEEAPKEKGHAKKEEPAAAAT